MKKRYYGECSGCGARILGKQPDQPRQKPDPPFGAASSGRRQLHSIPPSCACQLDGQGLTGLSHWQKRHVAPWDVNVLTPIKLAHFYRHVGGDYDSLFLETEEASLSFIYQSLGCFHSLQPENNPYVAPRIPALTPQGFVRWQTVQLLLEPAEHVPFLQNAVKRLDIINPADGRPFLNVLPKEVLPARPDPQMIEWYATVSEKLRLEAQASAARSLPPRPPKLALSDVASSRDSSVDSHSITGYFPRPRSSPRSAAFTNGPPSVHIPPQFVNDAPWSPERRRNSLPDNRHPAYSPQDGRTPTLSRSYTQLPIRNTRPPHVRVASDVSTISTSTDDSSSITSSSPSMSPVRYQARINPQFQPPTSPEARRHSTHQPRQRPISHPQEYLSYQRQPSGEYRTKNVRWQDTGNVFKPDFNMSNYGAQVNRSSSARSSRPGDGEWEERGRGRTTAPFVGVGGRKYPGGGGWK